MTPLPKGRPTVCLIDLGAVRWNFRQARKKVGPQVKILSVDFGLEGLYTPVHDFWKARELRNF